MLAQLWALYLTVQGVLVLGWWLVLRLVPSTEPLFFAGGPSVFFALPDMLLVGLGPLVTAFGWRRRWRLTPALAWLVAGGTTYGALYTLSASLLSGRAWLAPLLMTPAAAGSLLAALALERP